MFISPGPIYSPFPRNHLSYLLMVYLIYFRICPPFFSSLPQLKKMTQYLYSLYGFCSVPLVISISRFRSVSFYSLNCLDFCLTFSGPPYCQSCNTHSYLGSYSNSGMSLQEWELTTCQPTFNTGDYRIQQINIPVSGGQFKNAFPMKRF